MSFGGLAALSPILRNAKRTTFCRNDGTLRSPPVHPDSGPAFLACYGSSNATALPRKGAP